MKQIKPVVLKDATKLTNSEMKKIRGGLDPGYPATCSAVCYNSTGAMLGSFEKICTEGYYCDLVSGTSEITLGCFRFDPDPDNINIVTDPIAGSEKTCSEAFPGQI